jgi:hypothetical protein
MQGYSVGLESFACITPECDCAVTWQRAVHVRIKHTWLAIHRCEEWTGMGLGVEAGVAKMGRSVDCVGSAFS